MTMHPAVVEILRPENLPFFEGEVQWMYLDSAKPPRVTCGIGRMLPTVEDALSIPWEVSGHPALPSSIRADWDVVTGKPGGHTPKFYEPGTACTLPAGWAEKDLAKQLENKYLPMVKKDFAGYDGYPLAAQVALLDIAYNAGDPKGWTHLIEACESGNWAAAAASSHRKSPVPNSRNEWAKQKFLSCA